MSGCKSATLVRVPGTSDIPSQYAPLNRQDNDFGIVSYLDEGSKAVRDARKKDAYKKMYEVCDGRYVVLDESYSESDPVFSIYGNTTFTTTSTTIYISFECASE